MGNTHPKYGFHQSMAILNEKGWPVGFDGKLYTLSFAGTSWTMPTLWHPKEWNWLAEAAFLAWMTNVALDKYKKHLNIYQREKRDWAYVDGKYTNLPTVVTYSGSFSDSNRWTRTYNGGQHLRVRSTNIEAALAACVALAQSKETV